MDNRIFEFLNKSYKNSTEVKIVSLLKKELDKLKEEAHLNYLKNFLVKNEKLLEKNTSEEFSQNFKDIIYKSEILKEMNYPKKIKLIKDLFNYKGENFEKEPFYIAKKGDILEWSEEDGCYTKDGICINGVESAGYIALKEGLKVGTKVVHPKYGKGIVIKDTEGLCKPNESFVKFENSTGRVVPNGGLTGQGAFNTPSSKEIVDDKELMNEDKKITIKARDGENTLEELLNYIKSVGNTGHSFEIVADPDLTKEEGKESFFWDGDGSDSILDIQVEDVEELDKNGEPLKEYDCHKHHNIHGIPPC